MRNSLLEEEEDLRETRKKFSVSEQCDEVGYNEK